MDLRDSPLKQWWMNGGLGPQTSHKTEWWMNGGFVRQPSKTVMDERWIGSSNESQNRVVDERWISLKTEWWMNGRLSPETSPKFIQIFGISDMNFLKFQICQPTPKLLNSLLVGIHLPNIAPLTCAYVFQ